MRSNMSCTRTRLFAWADRRATGFHPRRSRVGPSATTPRPGFLVASSARSRALPRRAREAARGRGRRRYAGSEGRRSGSPGAAAARRFGGPPLLHRPSRAASGRDRRDRSPARRGRRVRGVLAASSRRRSRAAPIPGISSAPFTISRSWRGKRSSPGLRSAGSGPPGSRRRPAPREPRSRQRARHGHGALANAARGEGLEKPAVVDGDRRLPIPLPPPRPRGVGGSAQGRSLDRRDRIRRTGRGVSE